MKKLALATLVIIITSFSIFLYLRNTSDTIVRESIKDLVDNNLLIINNETHYTISAITIDEMKKYSPLIEGGTVVDLEHYMSLYDYIHNHSSGVSINTSKVVSDLNFTFIPPDDVVDSYIVNNSSTIAFSIPLLPSIATHISGLSKYESLLFIILDPNNNSNIMSLDVHVYKLDQWGTALNRIKQISRDRPLIVYFGTWGYVRKSDGTVKPVSDITLMELIMLEHIASKYNNNLKVALLIAPMYSDIHPEVLSDSNDPVFNALSDPAMSKAFLGNLTEQIGNPHDMWYTTVLYYNSKSIAILDTIPSECETNTITCWYNYFESQLQPYTFMLK